jgi:hypothetical protein
MFTRNGGQILIAILVVGVGVVSAAGVRRRHAKPRELGGIPARDYQTITGSSPASVLAISKVAVSIAPSEPPAAPGTAGMALRIGEQAANRSLGARLYQFAPTSLQIDHCSISRIALVIQEDGSWRLNLQADQNPRTAVPRSETPPVAMTPIRGLPNVQTKQTAHIKRNLFIVRVRGLGAFAEPLATPPSPPSLGKPVLLALGPIEFWVQNGVPYPLVIQGRDDDAACFFDRIYRAEIEFTYR